MPLNTAAEGFKEELMNTSEWKHGSQYNIPVKRLHKQPLNKALATASVGNPNKTTTHFYFYIFLGGGVYKNNLICQMSTPCLIGRCNLRVSQSPHTMEMKEGNCGIFMFGEAEEPVPSSVNVVHRYKWTSGRQA